MRNRFAIGFTCLGFAAASLSARVLAAQQTQVDLHGNYSHAVPSGTNSYGAGIALPLTWGARHAPVKVATSPGADYLKQSGGPSQPSVSLDVTAQPGGSSKVTPYAGGSVSANWSTGSGKQWDGAKLGLETLAGLQLELQPNKLSAKAEERYGYVNGSDHTWTTRVGLLISL